MKKNLATFSKRDRKRLLEIMKRIIDGDMHGLDIKKLKGRNLAFRVRKANFRIIFAKQQNGDIRIIAIERRSESTYK